MKHHLPLSVSSEAQRNVHQTQRPRDWYTDQPGVQKKHRAGGRVCCALALLQNTRPEECIVLPETKKRARHDGNTKCPRKQRQSPRKQKEITGGVNCQTCDAPPLPEGIFTPCDSLLSFSVRRAPERQVCASFHATKSFYSGYSGKQVHLRYAFFFFFEHRQENFGTPAYRGWAADVCGFAGIRTRTARGLRETVLCPAPAAL